MGVRPASAQWGISPWRWRFCGGFWRRELGTWDLKKDFWEGWRRFGLRWVAKLRLRADTRRNCPAVGNDWLVCSELRLQLTNLGSIWFCGVGGRSLRLLRLRSKRFD